ncbi:MAG TPA: aldo/keto reductase [Candidatus Paceibacterota bacterium]|nr:aldo/keto reductase [Candidatus Paceibacterota bacterium]
MTPQSTVSLQSGNVMPIIGLGTWELIDDTAGAVQSALELGYAMIDTSGDYGTQPGIGEALRAVDIPREQLFIVTKVEETGDAYEAAAKNLQELGLPYANLILIHRPPKEGVGVELWQGLIRAKKDGLADDIGVSNYSIAQMRELADATGEMPAVNQIEWSPFGHSQELLAYAKGNGLVLQAYSPLARGMRLRDPRLVEVAAKYGKTPAQVTLRWDIQHGVVPIPKANKRQHQEENLGIFDFELASDDMAALDALNERYSSLGQLPY